MKKVLLPTLVSMALFGCASSPMTEQQQAQKAPDMPLKYLANQINLGIGAALETAHLQDPLFKQTLIREFSQITPENEMKFMYLQPEQNRFDFSKGDQLVDFAVENDMTVKGHALVWHIQNPQWLEEGEWSKQELKDILENHIKTVVGHYRGKIAYWDVVNEAFDDNGLFRDTLWYRTLGEEYIEMAFRWAHEADPDALLHYNDYSTEGMNTKSNAVYRHLKTLIEKGVPIHGVGTQLHLTGDHPVNDARIARNIERLSELGLDIHFTEIDVRIRDSNDDSDLQDQAQRYERLTQLAAYYPEVDLITTWGVSDKYSWIPSWFKGYGRALMFDESYQPKPAYHAVQNVLNEAATGNFSYQPAIESNGLKRSIQPFNARQLTSDKFDAANVVYYPFAYNQLNNKDQTLPERHTIDGKWAVGYHMNKLVGQVIRNDKHTVIDHQESHENDNVEVFVRLGDDFWQFRAIVGQDFSPIGFPGKATGTWNADGSVFDFTVEFDDYKDLVGETIGFNIALSDNDSEQKNGTRHAQLYPLSGNNIGWQGEEFGELFMNGQNAVISPIPVANPPAFKLTTLDSTPDSAQEVWDQGYRYSLAFNQLNQKDMTVDSADNFSGNWSVAYHENWLYGVVNRIDEVTVTDLESSYQNDNVEIFIQQDDEGAMTHFRTVVGQDFERTGHVGGYKAQWNEAGTQLFFAIELDSALKRGDQLKWNIALAGNDGTQRKYQLYPIPGSNIAYLGEELTKLQVE
ncbi:hypothetical protein GCM10007916_28100 [Psychromonas marina]|uniref:Beta-xylanase n=1 Tax=Psychromonas marina TaxID=88364 RepID=A0ABQ6E3G8_9GAMM|nr:endo-1,4-beta-xylanase [Psychromonas marina]GLS91740.1 hypothetical protein GCM10007916_28100 [Psychromonas marina]